MKKRFTTLFVSSFSFKKRNKSGPFSQLDSNQRYNNRNKKKGECTMDPMIPIEKMISEELMRDCLLAIKAYPEGIKHLTNQPEALCLAAVEEDGLLLQYVKNQSEAICLAAVEQNSFALKYVADQNEQMCLAAVKKDGYALQYVKNQSEAICHAAVKQNPHVILYVKPEFKEEALKLVRMRSFFDEDLKNAIKLMEHLYEKNE